MENLAELKKQVLEYCDRRKANGGMIVEYNCPDCNSTLVGITPNKKGETWDTASKCYECGQLHFIVQKVGKIAAKSFNLA